jgi:hypothetical protein
MYSCAGSRNKPCFLVLSEAVTEASTAAEAATPKTTTTTSSSSSYPTERYSRHFSVCQEIFLYSKMQTCFVTHPFSC